MTHGEEANLFVIVGAMLALGAAVCAAADAPAATQPGGARPSFRPSALAGEFEFETGVLRGKLRAGGKSLGLTSVVHVPTETPLSRSNGLLSHYRVFTTNHRYGNGAWDWPSTATLRDDGAVVVRWPAAAERPFELQALYRFAAPNAIDLDTTITAQADLPAFEAFVACYHSDQFTSASVYVQGHERTGNKPGLLAAEKNLGDWLMSPRDDAAVAMIRDGRWKIAPNPVDWALLPRLGKPLAVRRDGKSGVAAVLMSRPQDCFAVAMPYQTESHFSMYLSLFGRVVKAGETVTTRARLVVLQAPTDGQLEQAYAAFAVPEGQ
jgi:hypothetical protein